MPETVIRLSPVPEPGSILGDEERLPFSGERFDLVVSLLALHGVNDLPGALVQIRRALKADGLFIGALLGGATLIELRQSLTQAEAEIEGGASPRVAPFADLRDIGGLLQRAGFALPVTDSDVVRVRYAHAFALMQDLRRMGLTNALQRPAESPAAARDPAAGGRDLCGALRRCRRPHSGDLRDRLAVRLDPAREPAEAPAPRLRQGAAGRRPGGEGGRP